MAAHQPKYDIPTSESLLSRARRDGSLAGEGNGDPNRDQAWGELAAEYERLVYHWLSERGVSRESLEALFEDVLVRVERGLPNFERRKHGDFRRWLKTLTKYAALDHRRERACSERAMGGTDALEMIHSIPDPHPTETTDTSAESVADSRKAIVQALVEQGRQHFCANTWTAFWQTFVEDRSAADVAKKLGMSSEAVRQNKRRVLKWIKRQFAEAGKDLGAGDSISDCDQG